MSRTSEPAAPAHDRPKLRLFVGRPLAEGAQVEPDQAQAHYLLTVMRQRLGDRIALFNGRDGEWLAVIEAAVRRGARLAVTRRLRSQAPEPGPTLLFAPLKRARLELLIEKATELGARSLQPVLCRRSVVDRVNRARLRTIAIEAAEQCGRLTIPEIGEPMALDDSLAHRPAGARLYFGDETGGGLPILEALRSFGAGDLLIGPEGGFAPEELAGLRARPDLVGLSLGPRTLRAETAALAALACWQAALGGDAADAT